MEKKTYQLKYGRGELAVSLPANQIYAEVWARDYPGIADVPQAVRAALARPIDAPPLKELLKPGEKVVIAVSDITRVWQRMDLVLPVLLDEINEAGIADERVKIVLAVGGHRLNSREEIEQICGSETVRRVEAVNHDACDLANMVYLGRTSRGTEVAINRLAAEADRIILTGGIIYHYMVGYGGGRKSVIPGLSSINTIRQNHLWALGREEGSGANPNSISGKTRGNECHEDMMEIAGLVQPDFIVNMVPNAQGDFAGVFAGNWVSAWEAGTRLVDHLYSVEIPGLADLVIASAGGYPKDINLYQVGKAMDNAFWAVREGGAVIILGECQDILEPPEFSQWFDHRSKLAIEKALRQEFTIPGWVALREFEGAEKAACIMVTRKENAAFIKKAGIIFAETVEEALEIAAERCPAREPKITVMPHGANTFPVVRGNG